MKVTTKETNTFKPFTIGLTIESIDELKELHNRLNVSVDSVNLSLQNGWCKGYTDSLLEIINDKLKDSGISYDM